MVNDLDACQVGPSQEFQLTISGQTAQRLRFPSALKHRYDGKTRFSIRNRPEAFPIKANDYMATWFPRIYAD